VVDEVSWQGLETLQGILRGLPENGRKATFNETYLLASEIFADSQIQVPVRTGVLRGSGYVDPSSPDEIDIGYGGPAPYALWVHENQSAHHVPPGKAKYLSDPFNARIGELEPRLAAAVEGAIIGQYPQQPSRAQGQAMRREQAGHKRAKGPIRTMTSEEIRQAIHAIATGRRVRGGMLRHSNVASWMEGG
jgi:hypothetical protein